MIGLLPEDGNAGSLCNGIAFRGQEDSRWGIPDHGWPEGSHRAGCSTIVDRGTRPNIFDSFFAGLFGCGGIRRFNS
jgi:hypothetical protein